MDRSIAWRLCRYYYYYYCVKSLRPDRLTGRAMGDDTTVPRIIPNPLGRK